MDTDRTHVQHAAYVELPETTDEGSFLYQSVETWETKQQALLNAEGDADAEKKALANMRNFDAAGLIMETEKGMDAPSPCQECTKKGETCRVWKDKDEACAYCKRHRKSNCRAYVKPVVDTVMGGTEEGSGQAVDLTTARAELDVAATEAIGDIESARIEACNALADAGSEAADQVTEALSEAKDHIAGYGNGAMNLIRDYHVKANKTFKAAINEAIQKSNEALSETMNKQRELLSKVVPAAKEVNSESTDRLNEVHSESIKRLQNVTNEAVAKLEKASGEAWDRLHESSREAEERFAGVAAKKPQAQGSGEVSDKMFRSLVLKVKGIEEKHEKDIAELKEVNEGLKGELTTAR
ncbi:hypothetical protein LTR95_013893 [Oleoguttula sp. CCFEE 5521]